MRCKISDEHAELKIIPEVNNKDYLYTFYMIKDGEVIKNTSQNNNDKVVFEIPPESGIYTFGCTLVDKSDNQETIVYSIESKKID